MFLLKIIDSKETMDPRLWRQPGYITMENNEPDELNWLQHTDFAATRWSRQVGGCKQAVSGWYGEFVCDCLWRGHLAKLGLPTSDQADKRHRTEYCSNTEKLRSAVMASP